MKALNAKISNKASPLEERRPIPEVTMKREFKIWGQIGDGGQKEKLSYTNLLHQINGGLTKGYPEVDVIEAVIRAVSPGLALRSILETKSDLTIFPN